MPGCTTPDELARAFVEAAAHLASEAVLLVERETCDDAPMDLRALDRAASAAEELALLARRGVAPAASYAAAADALRSAAFAVASARLKAPRRAGRARRPPRGTPRRSSSGCSSGRA